MPKKAQLRNAMQAVRDKKQAKEFNVPRRTLRNHFKLQEQYFQIVLVPAIVLETDLI